MSDPNGAESRVTTHEFARQFHCPSGLSSTTLLKLEVQLVDLVGFQSLQCLLNDQLLESVLVQPGRWHHALQLDWLRAVNQLGLRIVSQRSEWELPQVALLLTDKKTG